jgi:hypothetical protein
MKRFTYLRDPLFVLCLALYALNRWVFKPLFSGGFFHCYFNDLICIPFWIPIMLFTMRKLGVRKDDAPPRASEVLVPLILWAALFELVLPHTTLFKGLTFGDHVDVFYYALGALIATIFWNRRPSAQADRSVRSDRSVQ